MSTFHLCLNIFLCPVVKFNANIIGKNIDSTSVRVFKKSLTRYPQTHPKKTMKVLLHLEFPSPQLILHTSAG